MARLWAWLGFTVAGAAAIAALHAAGPGNPDTVIGWLGLAGSALVLAGIARFDDWGE